MTTMNSHNQSKINLLLKQWPRGTVGVQAWLKKQGIYRQLAENYCQGKWLKRIGHGVYIIEGDHVDWTGAIYALQFELGMRIHIAAVTALTILGRAHFLPLGKKHTIWLFKDARETRNLPVWFQSAFSSEATFRVNRRKLFEGDWDFGLIEKKFGEYSVLLSSSERAIMEYLDLVPQQQSLEHGYLLMEGLNPLRSDVVQILLERCYSVKVKRLFMYLAEHANHEWVKMLNLSKVKFGYGKRVIGQGGKLDTKYNLSLPDFSKEENQS